MDLEALPALLPDNTTGAISAQDLRTIITELYERLAVVEAKVLALETAS